MFDLFTQLTVIIVLASVLGILARRLRQPTIIAYLLAGMAVALFGFFELAENKELFDIFSDLGIMFVLFLIGLEVNYKSLRVVGRDSVLIGVGQIIVTFIFGYFLAQLFDFNTISSVYIALALTFSSTVIIANLLSEKKDLNNLYGKISIGIMLVQDFVVVLVLLILAGVGTGTAINMDHAIFDFINLSSPGILISLSILFTLAKGAIIFIIAFWLSTNLIPRFFDSIARSRELVFLSSLAWLFALTWLVAWFGFSREIGGFLAGLTLANSYEQLQIANRIKSLKDFFILVFFVILGASVIAFSNFSGIILAIIVFSLFVLIGNPLLVMLIMRPLGYRKRVSFLTGVVIAQVSEFSLILAAVGFKLGHLNDSVVTLITSVGVITMAISTYLILYSKEMYKKLSPYLSIFEKKSIKNKRVGQKIYQKSIILVGFNRTGRSIAYTLPKEDLLLIDFNPGVVKELKENKFTYIFGDITDPEILERAGVSNAKIIISTCPDLDSNIILLKELRDIKKRKGLKAKIIVRAGTDIEANILYENKADYCLLPHFTAGRYLAKIISTDPLLKNLSLVKQRDQALLKKDHFRVVSEYGYEK